MINVANPPQSKLIRDLKNWCTARLLTCPEKLEATSRVWVSESDSKQYNFNSTHSGGIKSAVMGFDDTRLFPHIRKSNDMSDNILPDCASTK